MTLAQQDGPALPQQAATLWDAFQTVVRESPDRTAIRCCSQSSDDFSWLSPALGPPSTVGSPLHWTYSQLSRAAEALAQWLDRSGLQQGSVLAVFCTGNTAEWVALFWACLCFGATFAPLNARLVDRPEELRHVLELLQPSGIVSLDGHAVGPLSKKVSELVDVEGVKFRLHNGHSRGGRSSPDGWQALSILGHAAQETQSHYVGDSTDRNNSRVALILLTSGTTAMPKAAAHTDANLLSESALYSYARGLDVDSTVMMVGPAFHILGIWSMLMAWRAGATVLIPATRFDAAASVSALNKYAVTHLPCSPSVIDALVSQPEFSSNGYDNLKALAIGSDRVSENLLRKCESFGTAKIINGWGMTECIGILSFDFSESIPWREDKLSIGHVMPGSTIKVCSFDSINVTTRGEIGELHVSGSSVIDGYFDRGRVHRSEQFHEADGKIWFATGDAVVMDDSGAVYVTGRRKDLIIRGGENFHPGLIERCINTLETVNVSSIRPDRNIISSTLTIE
jgi:acyl-CoA synthetase (AMP-forming)/AMP-acid ligase II